MRPSHTKLSCNCVQLLSSTQTFLPQYTQHISSKVPTQKYQISQKEESIVEAMRNLFLEREQRLDVKFNQFSGELKHALKQFRCENEIFRDKTQPHIFTTSLENEEQQILEIINSSLNKVDDLGAREPPITAAEPPTGAIEYNPQLVAVVVPICAGEHGDLISKLGLLGLPLSDQHRFHLAEGDRPNTHP